MSATRVSFRRDNARGGGTLVEVMIAAVVLMVIALAGGAFLYHGRANVAIQKNKRVALEVANSRLEDLRASAYDDIKPPTDCNPNLNTNTTPCYRNYLGS